MNQDLDLRFTPWERDRIRVLERRREHLEGRVKAGSRNRSRDLAEVNALRWVMELLLDGDHNLPFARVLVRQRHSEWVRINGQRSST